MKGPHDYNADCQCYKCKGIRHTPPSFHTVRRRATFKANRERKATREEQNARYIDCGPSNWDDR